MKKFKEWLALLLCSCLLAACGGGGGNPGTVVGGGGNNPSKVASVVLTSSAATMDASGADGTEVTLTVIVKDANNSALANQTVSLKADSGNISNTSRTTDNNGQVIEKLNTKGNTTPRTITITASVGDVNSTPVTVAVVTPAAPTLLLQADSNMLQSAGASGAEVTLTALVKDASNNVIPGVKVTLSADSGSLTLGTRISDSNGRVQEKLSTGGDPTSRVIKVTATVAGTAPVSTLINVLGTHVQINANNTVNVGSSTDATVKLVDSLGNALSGRAVTFSSTVAGRLAVKGGGAAVTNTAGQLILSYTASGAAGQDVITVSALGETATLPINVSATNFTVAAVDGLDAALSQAVINVCQKVAIHSDSAGVPQAGTVSLQTSRGSVYADAACGTLLITPLTLVNGNAIGYVKAQNPGLATLNATLTASAVTAQGVVEFVAPLTPFSTVSLQADPAVVGVNVLNSTAQQATLRAVVRDGTSQNNLVKNAIVTFTVLSDPTGGFLTQPSVVSTGSDGSATVSYVAGTNTSQVDGVQIQASVQGVAASAVVKLTVAQKALFISAGTGNTVGTPGSPVYSVDYAVLVTDAAGNPRSGVNVTGSVRPLTYYKGTLAFQGTVGPWDYFGAPLACANEDVDGDGIMSGGEDFNGNGRLDPGIPVTVTPSATTDATGRAIVTLTYPRDRAKWLDVELTIRGQVAGTETRYVGLVRLPGLGADYVSASISPPGQTSPYGKAATCLDPN
jgi:hypothetical protein